MIKVLFYWISKVKNHEHFFVFELLHMERVSFAFVTPLSTHVYVCWFYFYVKNKREKNRYRFNAIVLKITCENYVFTLMNIVFCFVYLLPHFNLITATCFQSLCSFIVALLLLLLQISTLVLSIWNILYHVNAILFWCRWHVVEPVRCKWLRCHRTIECIAGGEAHIRCGIAGMAHAVARLTLVIHLWVIWSWRIVAVRVLVVLWLPKVWIVIRHIGKGILWWCHRWRWCCDDWWIWT